MEEGAKTKAKRGPNQPSSRAVMENQGGIRPEKRRQGTFFNEQTGIISSVAYTASLFPKQVKKEQNKLPRKQTRMPCHLPSDIETSETPRDPGGRQQAGPGAPH